MTTLASVPFLTRLQALYPSRKASTPAELLAQPWYLVAAIAFSASGHAEAVPMVSEFVLDELKSVQTEEGPEEIHEQRMGLANKMREALLQSGALSGMPTVIESLIALYKATPEELHSKEIIRDRKRSMEDWEKSGKRLFQAMYHDTAETVQGLLDSAYLDLGWYCSAIGYGITYGGTSILTQVETSYALVAALIAVDAPRQITWHMANARHGGATLEEARAVREIAMTVARSAGVNWRDGVPEVVETEMPA